MSKIVEFLRREPVAVLGVLAVIVQGVLEAATAEGVTSWGQLVTLVATVAARRLVTPVAAPNLPADRG